MHQGTDGASILDAIRSAAAPITDQQHDYDGLINMVGDARIVLIGEASHGTHDFYRTRADLTKRLILEKGFSAIAVEADWPDAYRVNCFVRGASDDLSPENALDDFRRFPQWMWRNTVVTDFVGWLRAHNARAGLSGRMTGFYGMDLYSLNTSVERVIGYLNSVDPEAAKRAQDRYSCFEFTGNDPEAYGYASAYGVSEPCEDEVVEQLVEMQRRRTEVVRRDGRVNEDEAFEAEQNARLVKNAEEYYRSMFHGRVSSWNLRDRHMVETLSHLVNHLNDTRGRDTRLVVWAHNSHLGDARATEMSQRGEWNVGQLIREQYGSDAVLIGFTTHTGTVTAATNWGDEAEPKIVNPSMRGSYERLFHEVGIERFWLNLRDDQRVASLLREQRLERAIGVIYRPETERWSHYFYASLPDQFDAVVHLDETTALQPLERYAAMPVGDLPETYPFGDDAPTPNAG